MKDEKLMPCPFCGGEAEVISKNACLNVRYSALCKDKKCIGRGHKTYGARLQAISAWNKRWNNESNHKNTRR